MKRIENKPMLITYADGLGGDLLTLRKVLDDELRGAFGGVHVLPFYRSSGDRGFAVIDYDDVDPAFGTWDDIDALADRYFVMADFMVNHVSIRSQEFQDYVARGDASPYRDMFIHWSEFWEHGEPTQEEMAALYRRKPGGPVKTFTLADGSAVQLWNTFFDEQVDIDPRNAATRAYYDRNLGRLADHVPLIRFDAFAYATKKAGTSSFFVEPDVWEVLDIAMKPLEVRGTEMLPEIHEHYSVQMKMADRGHWVYDFALPMLMLHAVMTGRTDRLHHWMTICPRKQFTTLDTHDGIGVVDVADLLSEDEIEFVSDRVNAVIADSRHLVQGAPSAVRRDGQKAKPYQLMSSYFSALGGDSQAYLLARVVQLFAPGIPQVWSVGLLFGANDVEALAASGDPRAINRHDYSREEIAKRITDPDVAQYLEVLRYRNSSAAFAGEVAVKQTPDDHTLHLSWTGAEIRSDLRADFRSRAWTITETDGNGTTREIMHAPASVL
ncbi:sucrose phosphorylase [Curtobacterium oceanosedimentum]|nr:sucrose phosphorylase [Curtobacterium oceanosedimentum]